VTSEAHGELQRAITSNELELHYQPVFDIDGRTVREVEALVRWRHPTRGIVSPDAILPLAESEGLMHDLTTWVLREAILQSTVWRRDGTPARVAVNIAASDLGHDRFRRLLDRSLQIAGSADAFGAEVRAPRQGDAGLAAVADLRARHIPVTLDDVTSVEHLERGAGVAIDQIKVGREVIARATSDAEAAKVARAIVAAARARRVPVVAVGVEDAATLEFVREAGCAGVQGYLLARPMTSTELGRWMRSRD